MLTSRKAQFVAALIPFFLIPSFESQAQWVQVNNGLIDTTLHIDDMIIVSLGTDCVDVHSGPSVTDSIYGCVPAGYAGQIINGPSSDEHGSSNLTFWGVRFNGIGGWCAGKYLHRTNPYIPNVYSISVIGTSLFVGASGRVYRSTDNGTNWMAVSTTSYYVSSLTVSGTTLFAGTSGDGILRSTDNGVSWIQVNTGLTSYGITSFGVSRTCLFANTDGGTFRSTTNGTTWESVTCPGTLAIIDTNLFAGPGDGSIFLSTDTGTSWKKVRSGRTPVENDYSFSASGKYLFFIAEGMDPDVCVDRMTWADTGLVYDLGMNFPPSYVPCSANVGGIRTFGPNVYLSFDGDGDYFSTNSGKDWVNANWPFSFSTLVVSGSNLFVGGTGVWRNSLSNALPIQLASFNAATLNNSGVNLTWTTVSETNNYGFYVQRNGADVTFIAGHGTTIQQHSYSYTDNPPPGRYQYQLKQVDLDGTSRLSESLLVDVAAPTKFALEQNYPNPFNPATTIRYGLPARSHVTLSVYTALGQHVAELVNADVDAGNHDVRFDGSKLASGVYFYRLIAGEHVDSKKLLLMK